MNINQNQFEILVYVEREGGKKITQRQMAEGTKLSLGVVNKTLSELVSLGLVTLDEDREVQITKTGLDALEPYRVKRAVVIAAGFGSRMVPITLNTPKPLVRVHGKKIIETLLDAVVEAGIPEIVLVRGYLGEQFDVLKDRYPNIKFLNNPMFNESNNISSVLIARDYLAGAYVMEADLLLANPRIVRKYEYCSNYLGEYRDMTDDWCFDVKKGLIKKLNVGGTNCYHMFGISYWTREDGKRLADCVEKTWKMPGGKERYWDEVPLRTFQKEFEVAVRPCEAGDLVEIDTFKELKQIDPVYAMQ
ncbi:MAG: NTP transferase domain-containing protein [Lachnospiraceae bacterium]|nr:NTP transferase domain-containing protein [Candidatus Fimimorpha excrementavium]